MSNTSEPLRVLHVIPTLAKGGAERLCMDIVRQLNDTPDVEVRLVTFRDLNLYAEEYPDIHPQVLDVHVIPSISGKWDVKLDDWKRVIAEFRPHIIHSHLYEAEMVVHHKLLPSVRYVMHCHQHTPQLRPFSFSDLLSKERVTQLYERSYLIGRFIRCNNLFLTISQTTEAYFKGLLPKALHPNVYLLPNAICTDRFISSAIEAPAPGHDIELVNIGRFTENKNQRFLLSVMRVLKDKGVPARLTLIGEGAEREAVQQMVTQMGLGSDVRFCGNKPNVEQYLRQSHLYVHSALKEGFGLVLLEAMATGLPVVTLDGGGNRDLIEEGKNGYMLTEMDAEVFADRIMAVCSDASRYQEMADHAREFAKQYDIVPYCERLMGIYRQATSI